MKYGIHFKHRVRREHRGIKIHFEPQRNKEKRQETENTFLQSI